MMSPQVHVAMTYIDDEARRRTTRRRKVAVTQTARKVEAPAAGRVRRGLARLHLAPLRNA
jgi:hypothetical protein